MNVLGNTERRADLPDAFDLIPQLRSDRARTRRLLVGLDFDGTLARIVPTPAEAQLLPGAAPVLAALAARSDTVLAIVTGRGVADARARVALPDIHYAGTHGMEIAGPGMEWLHGGALAARPFLDRLMTQLGSAMSDWPGVILEDKSVSLSVHFRTITDPREDDRIVQRVHEVAEEVGGPIRLTHGKKVVEIRPAVDWDKGHALVYLRDLLQLQDAPAIYIGDDRTDEDAFRELRGAGDAGIYAGPHAPADTLACAQLAGPDAVVRFLAELAA
jgi:trehalose 6-phosphate phosphatase